MADGQKRILIVEDDELQRRTLSQRFISDGFFVIEAKNGHDGLVQALKEHPDLILLDIIMPIIDGMALMESIRQDSWGQSVPIILMSNMNPDDAMLSSVMNNHPAYYMLKSTSQIDEYVDKVKEVLKIAS
jgi:CheY-like chemotaxis protein